MSRVDNFWLFYSANLWGSDDYGIGIAHCASVIGPCSKPLAHAWLSSTSSDGQSDPGPGGQEFFQVGGLIWMVHHGLAPGQTGNDAQRRLYVDLVAFPKGGLPRIASRPAAAALAEAILYYGDPNLPGQPTEAYLTLVRKVGDAFTGDSDASVVSDGKLVCADLSRGQSTAQLVGALQSQTSDPVRVIRGRHLRRQLFLSSERTAGTQRPSARPRPTVISVPQT